MCMRKWFIRQTKREMPDWLRWLALTIAGGVFLIINPLLLTWIGRSIDRWLGISRLIGEPYNWLIGGLLIGAGLPLAFWTVIVQGTIGRGTPIPILATQKLIIVPPYTVCRNPMALGTIMAYFGVAVMARSWGAVILAGLFMLLLLVYIKSFEEQEMLERFGPDYAAYRKTTPFIIPHLIHPKTKPGAVK